MTLLRNTFALYVCLVILTSLAPFASADEQSDAQSGAQSTKFVPLTNVEGSRLQTVFDQSANTSLTLSDFFGNFFTTAISVGAILAVLRLGWAGYLYMTSSAGGSIGKAKEVIGDVVLGLFLLLSCWLILKQINPDILKLNILESLGQAKIQGTTPTTPAPAASPVRQLSPNAFPAPNPDQSIDGCGVSGCGEDANQIIGA